MAYILPFVWIVAGVAASLLIPVVRQLAFPAGTAKGVSLASRIWPTIRPYFLLGILSALLALVTFAIALSNGIAISRWYQAFLIGYFWDATIQKFRH